MTDRKTFSRARAAKAALVKLLIEDHEVPEAHVQITAFEPTAGRHTARVDFLVAQPELILQDLEEQGWTYTAPEKAAEDDGLDAGDYEGLIADLKKAAIIDMGEAGDATPYPAPAPATEDEVIALKSTPVDMGEAMTADEDEAIQNIGVIPAGASVKGHGYVAETSTAEGPTKRVWAIADSMPGAKRKDVIEACRLAGIAFGTARTQYQKWFSSKKNG